MKYQVCLIRTNKKGDQDKTVVSELYADGFRTHTQYDAVPYTTITFFNRTERFLREAITSDIARYLITGDYVVEPVTSV